MHSASTFLPWLALIACLGFVLSTAGGRDFLKRVAAVTFVTAHNLLRVSGIGCAPLRFAVVGDEKKSVDETLLASLGEITKRLKTVDEIQKAVGEQKSAYDQVTQVINEMKAAVDAIKKQQLAIRAARVRRGGEVSNEAARFLGAVHLHAGLTQGKIGGQFAEKAANYVADVIGKAALTSTDIPLPTEFSGEVVELVSEYGLARKYGTVYPLGSGTVKLPKLKTSPAFGLIAASAAVGEKVPQIEFVTFTASKWGGIIRMPSEIEEDSIVAMGQFLARYGAREMAKIEDVVFFTADGTNTYDSLSGLLKQFDVTATRVTMAAGAASSSEATLANIRAMRTKVASAVLGRSRYFFHPTFESLFASFNANGDKPYIANGINGASLDGFPIEWVDTLPALNTADTASTAFGGFGEPSYSYLGVRGGLRFDTSKEAGFTTDEILVRALERFTLGHMAADHFAIIRTGTA